MAGSAWSNQVQNLLIISTISGQGGIFVYNGTPGPGNGPVFWATEASTDPYGNAVTPTTGVAGTGQFNAGDTIINSAGIFVYSSTPALGNLVQSFAPNLGNVSATDGFGNTYYGGVASYTPDGSGGATTAVLLQDGNVLLGPPANFFSPFPLPGLSSGGAGVQSWQSGGTAAGDTAAIIDILSGNANGTAGTGQVNITGGLAISGGGQLSVPAGEGPFIAGEGFHTLSNATGVSGLLRVKLLPWNYVAVDMRCTVTLTGATQTLVFGNLPSSAYNPATNGVQVPVSLGGTPSTDVNPRMQISTSGGVQCVIPAGSGTSIQLGAQFYYPTN